jgi:hypothetical protein
MKLRATNHGDYYHIVAVERISKEETYEAWAYPVHRQVIMIRENEDEITRCSICTRPLPTSNGDIEKCPNCLHQYKYGSAIIKLDTEPVPITVQFDATALKAEDSQSSSFGIAFHPDAGERLHQLQPKEQDSITEQVTKSLEGYRCDRLKLRSGAQIILAKRLPTTRDHDRSGQARLRLLDKQLRAIRIGYILDPYELQRAQATCDRWSKAKTSS